MATTWIEALLSTVQARAAAARRRVASRVFMAGS
jgi:hypothetical protein